MSDVLLSARWDAQGWLRAKPRRLWLAVFALLSTIGLVWTLAMPLYAGPDEEAHVVRAVSLARGQFVGEDKGDGTGQLWVMIPGVYGSDQTDCFKFKPSKSAACQNFDNNVAERMQPSAAGRYPPGYYLLVGLGSLVSPTAGGMYLMRLLGALVSAAVFASAVLTLDGAGDRRLGGLGLMVALTPMMFFVMGIVNPSTPEVAGGVAVWVSGYVLVTGSRNGVDQRVLARFGVGALLLVLARTTGPLWLALAVVLLFFLATGSALRTLVGSKRVWAWGAAIVVATIGQLAWIRSANPLGTPDPERAKVGSFGDFFRFGIGNSWPGNELQMIGSFGWLDTAAPQLTYVIWTVAVGLLVIMCLSWAKIRSMVVLIVILVLTVALPAAVDAAQAADRGYIWQGRYTLPLAVAIPILSALIIGERGRGMWRGTRFFGIMAVLLFIAQELALWQTLRRFAVGSEGVLLSFWTAPEWSPPVSPLILLSLFALTYGALAFVLVGGGDPPPGPAEADSTRAVPLEADPRQAGGT